MNNTALRAGAQSANNTHMVFANEEHEKFYFEKLEQARYQDCYHKALIYILGISEDTRNHFSQIYDIKSGYIKTECLHQGWQTSGSVRVVRLAFNLYTDGTPSYILIDCMPSLGMITINAFACADSILIPVQAAYLPVKGLEQLIKTIGKVKRQINPKLEIEGILLTMVDNRTNYARDITALLIETYGSRVRIFENSIPMSVRAAETSAEGVSIYQHDPKGRVAGAYQSLTEEVLGNGQ